MRPFTFSCLAITLAQMTDGFACSKMGECLGSVFLTALWGRRFNFYRPREDWCLWVLKFLLQDSRLGGCQHEPSTEPPPSSTLPWKEWVKPNYLRIGTDRFNNNMFCWGLIKLPFCNCGPKLQSAQPLIYHCPIHQTQGGNVDLAASDETTIPWL